MGIKVTKEKEKKKPRRVSNRKKKQGKTIGKNGCEPYMRQDINYQRGNCHLLKA
jgi:hypothetical protein